MEPLELILDTLRYIFTLIPDRTCKILDLDRIYLGYWVDRCKAFSYKQNFKPQEILDEFPSIREAPNWKPFLNT